MPPKKGRGRPKAVNGGVRATNRKSNFIGHDRVHEPLNPTSANVFNTFRIPSEKYKSWAVHSNFQPAEGKGSERRLSGAFITLHYSRPAKRKYSEVGSDSAIDLKPPAADNSYIQDTGTPFDQEDKATVEQNPVSFRTETDEVVSPSERGVATTRAAISAPNIVSTIPAKVPVVTTSYESLDQSVPQHFVASQLKVPLWESAIEAQKTAHTPFPSNTQSPSSSQLLNRSVVAEGQQESPKRAFSSPEHTGQGDSQRVTTRSTTQRKNQLLTQLAQFPPDRGPPIDSTLPIKMAPVKDPSHVPNTIKDIIQHLYDIQSQTHGFIPETQDLLVDKMTDLTQSLSQLQKLTSTTESPNNPVHSIRIAPEIVDYVDDGRNPDIFTRDFVELVQRGNTVINGKQQAFKDFSQIYAKALKDGMSGIDKQVDQVIGNAGISESSQSHERTGTDGRNGQ